MQRKGTFSAFSALSKLKIPNGVKMDKSALRSELRSRRRMLDAIERKRAASALLEQFQKKGLWRWGKRWAFYLPFGAELDCHPLIAAAMAKGKSVFLPLVKKSRSRRLAFVRLDEVHHWRRSRLGMLEPYRYRRFVSARHLDVVCLPLLGFDRQGGRLGQGGGFYDATFSFRRSHFVRPRLLGLAFACQEVDDLPMEPWDVRLDWVVTEQDVIRCEVE